MRQDKTIVLLNGCAWLVDFGRGRVTSFRLEMSRCSLGIFSAFSKFDWVASLAQWLGMIRYLDYTDSVSLQTADCEANRVQHESGTQPAFGLALPPDAQSVDLAAEDVLENNRYYVISKILASSFQVKRIAQFHHDKVTIRPNPSVGARHGIEVYVTIGDNFFYYDALSHHLERLEERIEGESTIISLAIRSEIYRWRYPSSSVLADIYFDVGHAMGNINLVCASMGVNISILETGTKCSTSDLADLWPILSFELSDIN